MMDKQDALLVSAFVAIIVISYGISSYIESNKIIASRHLFDGSTMSPDIDVLYVILDESFDAVHTGSLPFRWEHTGNISDKAFVVYDSDGSFTKSLYLHEGGEDSKNSKVKITGLESRNLMLDFYYMINGSPAGRQVFQFYNEDDLQCVGMNTLIGYSWRYRGPDMMTKGGGIWTNIPGFGIVEPGRWYHIQIYADYELQRVAYGVDGVYSDWLPTLRQWSTITAISFRGNCNYPTDAWYDDVFILEYSRN
jgi:hypothetical protein